MWIDGQTDGRKDEYRRMNVLRGDRKAGSTFLLSVLRPIVAGCTTKELWFHSRQEQGNNFLFGKASRPALELTQPTVHLATGSKAAWT